MRIPLASNLFWLVLLCLAPMPRLGAATAPSLEGQSFTITIFSDQKKVLDKLTFTAKELGCAAVGTAKIPYTVTPDPKHPKDLNFSAETKDGQGNVITVTGTASGKIISGTIDCTPKNGVKKSLMFSGAKAGGGK